MPEAKIILRPHFPLLCRHASTVPQTVPFLVRYLLNYPAWLVLPSLLQLNDSFFLATADIVQMVALLTLCVIDHLALYTGHCNSLTCSICMYL